MDNDLFLYNRLKILTKFKVVGLLPSPHFQKCRFMVEKLHDCFPAEYDKPEIRAMLNLDWDEYLTKMRRRHGKLYYLLHVPVAVYLNGEFMGDDEALSSHVSKIYHLEPILNFQELANNELIKYFSDITEKYKVFFETVIIAKAIMEIIFQRKCAYVTVAIDENVVGSMLFMLYNDLVPSTCENFLSRCCAPVDGYKGTRVHRIVKYSWIQFGGFDLKDVHMPCENYAVPHNRRGVLSTCNSKRHVNNISQFFVTLEPTEWMDYNYVAFGQLIQGAEILNILEKVSTYYENPLNKIQIVNCGEFSLCPQLDEEYVKALNPPYETLFNQDIKPDDIDSRLSLTGYKAEKYFLKTDLRSYLPFIRYSRMFDMYLKGLEKYEEVEEHEKPKEEEIEEEETTPSSINANKLINSHTFYFTGSHVII